MSFLSRAPILALLTLVPVGRQAPIDLKVIDSRGTEVTVLGAAVDYGGMFSMDKETRGIRVMQGEGEVLVKWADVDTIRMTRTDESVKPPRIEVEVVLRQGKRVTATLLRKGQMKVVGRTDLGDYTIDLDKVRALVPAR